MDAAPGCSKWKTRVQGVLAACLIALPIACAEESKQRPPSDQVVVVSPVEARTFEVEIRASGQLEALEQAVVAAEIDGRVSELMQVEGDRVEADSIVLRIDPERRELAVASAQATLGEASAARSDARREHKRIVELQSKGAAANASVDSAATALEAAESRHRAATASLGVAERALRDADVSAPFAGVIARRYVSRGEYVRPGTPLFELVASNPLEVVFQLSEVDSGRVSLGNPVEVRVASHPEEGFLATVTMISPTIDPATRTLRVKAALDNADGRLRPGLFAHVELGVELREGVQMIPEHAVLQRASGPIVFVVGPDDRALKRRIETGLHREGEVEILSGLDVDDVVVAEGHSRLVDGVMVTPRFSDGRPFGTRTADASSPSEVATP